MADDSNSMQAQLGLFGQGNGSFNPLGVPTPPPPPTIIVKHPGEVSADIVRQTQTQMATTLQTTSAMRLGGMGGMAFGGGGGVGAVGAFAQQYQENMAGITSQYMNPISAQMMGVMSGVGSGFQSNMLPNPAMMTSPGMGIYRSFPQGPAPSVSPFPQMPLFQTPLTPMPPPPQFQTPMDLANNMSIQAGQRRTAAMYAMPGLAARAGTDIGFGYAGAGIGASLGARFGPVGALVGGGIGAVAGFGGSEHFGLGAAAEHITSNMNPFRTMAIRQQQMIAGSQNFVMGGPDLNPMTGRGLSSSGATHLARKLEDTAYSSQFQRETGGAFSAQDLTRITTVAGQQGLMNDAQSVDQIHDRVKGIAKALVSFMKIANEPSVVEALKSMGKMRAMGLSVSETMDMAIDARQAARMSGTSARGVMHGAGLQGAMMFQQQGLSAGLGMQMGVGAMGMAGAAVSGGAFSPQRLAMLGGIHGVAQHEMESSAAFLKMPMITAAMSKMGARGQFGLDPQALLGLRGGKLDVSDLATRGASNIYEAVNKQGIGAIGLMQVQGTELQDTIGRLLGPGGMKAAKMQQIEQTRKMMGLEKNAGGFATAGLALGFSADYVKQSMSEAQSPSFFQNLQNQNNTTRQDLRALELEEREMRRPGLLKRMIGTKTRGMFQEAYTGLRNVGENLTNMFGLNAEESAAHDSGQVIQRFSRAQVATSDDDFRRIASVSDEDSASIRQMHAEMRATSTRKSGRNIEGILGSQNTWDRNQGGDIDDRRQYRQMQGSWLGGGTLERGARLAVGVMGEIGGMAKSWNGKGGMFQGGGGQEATDAVFGSEAEMKAGSANLQGGADLWRAGTNMSSEARQTLLNETAAKTGVSADDLDTLVGKSVKHLDTLARAGKRTWGEDQRIDKDQARRAVWDAATGTRIQGMSVDAMDAVASGARDYVGGGNENAVSGADTVNMGNFKEWQDKRALERQQSGDVMFGSDNRGVWNALTGAVDTEREDFTRELFSGTSSGKAAGLLALDYAQIGKSHVAASATTARNRLWKEMSKEERKEYEVKKKQKQNDPRAEKLLTAYGQRAAGTVSPDDMAGFFELKYQESGDAMKENLQRSGRASVFGEDMDQNMSIKQMLTSGADLKMGAEGKRLSKKYFLAKTAEEKADIEKEAQAAMDTGGSTATVVRKGALGTAYDAIADTAESTILSAKDAMSGGFVTSVKEFSAASLELKDAAIALGKLADKGQLPIGGNMGNNTIGGQ